MAAPAQRKPGIFGIRDVQDLTTETHESGHELKRSVSAVQLTAMGVKNVRDGGLYSLHMDDPFGYDVQISGLENNALTDG